jgi:predicted GNAT superfamily acetyltransferase
MRIERDTPAVEVHAPCLGRRWILPGPADLGIDASRLAVAIPANFTEMQCEAPALALEWRMATRKIFQAYLGRYEVVDFERAGNGGRYLLERRG